MVLSVLSVFISRVPHRKRSDCGFHLVKCTFPPRYLPT